MDLPTKPDSTPTQLYNPDKDDFTYPLASDKGQVFYTLPSRQIVTFPKYIADHLAKHLAQKLSIRESDKIHYEVRFKDKLDQIYV